MRGRGMEGSLGLFQRRGSGDGVRGRIVLLCIIVIMRPLMGLNFRGFCRVWILLFRLFVTCLPIFSPGKSISPSMLLFTYHPPKSPRLNQVDEVGWSTEECWDSRDHDFDCQ